MGEEKTVIEGLPILDVTTERFHGYIVYLFSCPYCGTTFKSSSLQLKPKTGRQKGKNHCGCQTKLRKSTRIGVPPTNKLSKRVATVNYCFNAYKRSARTKQHSFELNREQISQMIFANCNYCGVEPTLIRTLGQGKWKRESLPTNGIDRLDSTLGYTEKNTVTCCSDCNYFKREKDYDTFLTKIRTIYENLNLGERKV